MPLVAAIDERFTVLPRRRIPAVGQYIIGIHPIENRDQWVRAKGVVEKLTVLAVGWSFDPTGDLPISRERCGLTPAFLPFLLK